MREKKNLVIVDCKILFGNPLDWLFLKAVLGTYMQFQGEGSGKMTILIRYSPVY
jgi:hypothetical protein